MEEIIQKAKETTISNKQNAKKKTGGMKNIRKK